MPLGPVWGVSPGPVQGSIPWFCPGPVQPSIPWSGPGQG